MLLLNQSSPSSAHHLQLPSSTKPNPKLFSSGFPWSTQRFSSDTSEEKIHNLLDPTPFKSSSKTNNRAEDPDN
ncbi:hypothetical protein PGT21_027768 [Puccinia graminis f. sp. tritici]|uniref:Uncharacterized protein n=1 Tax=Puccinia graminis f. sp. tritici TaxID=56615 RepID=A0A5B0R2E7_PUCGR|nr:hypothetical protein PGT21_027768 [Puccinia graminis f. sp. tritici]